MVSEMTLRKYVSIAVAAASLFVGLCHNADAQYAGRLKAGHVFGNPTSAESQGRDASLSAMFDQAFSATPGTFLLRGSSAWTTSVLGAGVATALGNTPNASGGLVTFNGSIGAATATSINGLQITNNGATGLAISSGQTIVFNQSMMFSSNSGDPTLNIGSGGTLGTTAYSPNVTGSTQCAQFNSAGALGGTGSPCGSGGGGGITALTGQVLASGSGSVTATIAPFSAPGVLGATAAGPTTQLSQAQLTGLLTGTLPSGLSAPTLTLTGLPLVTLTQDTLGSRIEIDKDTAPLNFSTTRAGFVFQLTDTGSGTANQLIPAAVFNMVSSGNGVVVPASRLSETVWEGIQAGFTKSGDGSGQVYTAIGQLEAVGPTGYNELGLFEGTATNLGSVLGTMSGLEVLLADGSSGTNFATHMNSVIGRLAVFNAGTIASNFFASSEGNTPVQSILSINPQSPVGWQIGLDLAGVGYAGSGALFTTGIAIRLPNNASLYALNAAGTSNVNIVFVDGSNNIRFGFGGSPSIFGGTLGLSGSTSGQATITAQAVAGTPTLTLPTASGTFADAASSPLVLNATTGALSCPTCATTATANVISVFGRSGVVTATSGDYSFSLISGVIASGQVSGSYTGITGVGTLAAGATGAGFTVALGTSTITGLLTGANGGTGVNNGSNTLTIPASGTADLLGTSQTISAAKTFSAGIILSGSPVYGLDFNGATPSTGEIRLGNNQSILARNAANSADIQVFFLSGSNQIQIGFGGTAAIFGGTLTGGAAFISTGAAPTCGTGCASVTGSSTKFAVTAGTAVTSITVNFAASYYASAPVCAIGSGSTASVVDVASVTASAITLGASVALTGGVTQVICVQ
jgi:hypothetical protein